MVPSSNLQPWGKEQGQAVTKASMCISCYVTSGLCASGLWRLCLCYVIHCLPSRLETDGCHSKTRRLPLALTCSAAYVSWASSDDEGP